MGLEIDKKLNNVVELEKDREGHVCIKVGGVLIAYFDGDGDLRVVEVSDSDQEKLTELDFHKDDNGVVRVGVYTEDCVLMEPVD